jgi:acyl dehydratase
MPEIFSVQSLRDSRGREVAVSAWRPITQARIDLFAEATDDHQWIHVDRARASASGFGSTIAHGFLTLSLLSAWAEETVAVAGAQVVINYGVNRVRFVSAVTAGSRLRAHFTPAAVDALSGGVQVTWTVIVECEGGDKPACVVDWILRYLTIQPAPGDSPP